MDDATGGSLFDPAGRADLGEVVVAEADLQARIAQLGKEITADYVGRAPLLVGVLKLSLIHI